MVVSCEGDFILESLPFMLKTSRSEFYARWNFAYAHTDSTCFPRWTNSSPSRELKGLFCSLNFRPDPSEGQSLLKNRPLMREWTKFMWRTWTDFICTIHKKLAIFLTTLNLCSNFARLTSTPFISLITFISWWTNAMEIEAETVPLWILFASKQLKPIAINWRTINNFFFDES